MDYNTAARERQMERVPADARGPQRRRQLRHVLTRLDAARIGVGRRHRQDPGCRQRRVPADAQYWQGALQHIIRRRGLIPSYRDWRRYR